MLIGYQRCTSLIKYRKEQQIGIYREPAQQGSSVVPAKAPIIAFSASFKSLFAWIHKKGNIQSISARDPKIYLLEGNYSMYSSKPQKGGLYSSLYMGLDGPESIHQPYQLRVLWNNSQSCVCIYLAIFLQLTMASQFKLTKTQRQVILKVQHTHIPHVANQPQNKNRGKPFLLLIIIICLLPCWKQQWESTHPVFQKSRDWQ